MRRRLQRSWLYYPLLALAGTLGGTVGGALGDRPGSVIAGAVGGAIGGTVGACWCWYATRRNGR